MGSRVRSLLVAAAMLAGHALTAHGQAQSPSDRLRQVLPVDVAEHVLATIAAARAHELPATALENRALKFAANGVAPAEIARAVDEQAQRMEDAKTVLVSARGRVPAGDEIEAGADALRRGVDGTEVSALARSAPSGRSLAVSLFVIGSLMDRGLPSDAALARVSERLSARAPDSEIEKMPSEVTTASTSNRTTNPTGSSGRTGTSGSGSGDGGATTTNAAGKPAGGSQPSTPSNGGASARPTAPEKGSNGNGNDRDNSGKSGKQ